MAHPLNIEYIRKSAKDLILKEEILFTDLKINTSPTLSFRSMLTTENKDICIKLAVPFAITTSHRTLACSELSNGINIA